MQIIWYQVVLTAAKVYPWSQKDFWSKDQVWAENIVSTLEASGIFPGWTYTSWDS